MSIVPLLAFLLLFTACSTDPSNHLEGNTAYETQTDNTAKQSIGGKVVGISDGDTFKLLVAGNKQLRVRLHGIDCPEKNQDFGMVARSKLSDLIFGKLVKVIEKDRDRYGRTIGIVYTAE